MKIYLFDSTVAHENLLPLSFTRPVADFRCGILTVREKWERYLPGEYSYYPVDYLRAKYGTVSNDDEEALFIAGNLLPREEIIEAIKGLKRGEGIASERLATVGDTASERLNTGEKTVSERLDTVVAFRGSLKELEDFGDKGIDSERLATVGDTASERLNTGENVASERLNTYFIEYVFDIFLKNGDEIKRDFALLTSGRKSQPLPDCVRILDENNGIASERLGTGERTASERFTTGDVFIEEGAVVECACINVKDGPVYIGKDAVLMEGACVRGPFAVCEGGEVRMGAKIYKSTTIGPHCKVGGEVNNTVFFGFSNKAHDGYLGNAVIGEWCNIGAGANASNLKNDYSLIRVWNYRTKTFMHTDLQFCGLIMGDHSKIGVNCMINSATVIGVGVNLHGAGFPRNFVPCFCEGSPTGGFSHVPLNKFLATAERVMSRRDISPTEEDVDILTHIYEQGE